MSKTLEAIIRKRWLPPELAVRQVVAFERRFGLQHLYLACHAALPLILTPELINLIRINFLDSVNIPWIAESDFLLSPMCRSLEEGVFEVEPSVREVLLIELENHFGWRRQFELADFLQVYLNNQPYWKQHQEVTRTQEWIAQAYLKPDGVIEKMKNIFEQTLPEDKPAFSPLGIEMATVLEIIAEPLERTNLSREHQFLVNSSRALAQIIYGEDEDLKEKIREEVESETGSEGSLLLSPVIRGWLTDVKITGIAVIITSIPVEYRAVRAHLTDMREEVHSQGTIYERGLFTANGTSWEVGIVELGVSNAKATVDIERAIDYFKPNVVLFVGVASGIKDVSLGDVVFATKVYGYDSGKVVKETFLPKQNVSVLSYRLEQRARAEAKKENWLKRILNNVLQLSPYAFIGPIAVGDTIFASNSSEVYQFLRSSYGDVLAVEIDNHEVIKAVLANPEINTFIIRGISDLISSKSKTDRAHWQEIAARHASAFAFEILANLNVTFRRTHFPPPSSPHPNFFAYDDTWVGRENLIQDLSRRVRGSCRLLILVGITGIGKTALGERLAVELSDWFDEDWSNYLQENFDNEEQANDFASVAARWLEKWGEAITVEDRKDTQLLLHSLVKQLRENRYLIQIDSLENILQGDEQEGWSDFKNEWWMRFFQSFFAADSCQSRIIITSQDLPAQIPIVGGKHQNFWYCQPLSGLEEPEQLALFEETGLDVSTESPGRLYLVRIGAAYEGHPLTLRVIAGEIKNKPFDGNVLAYWNNYSNEVEEIEKAIEEAKEGKTASADDQWQLDRFTRTLRRHVRSRLEKTFTRLEKDARYAYVLLCEASVYRCPVPEDFWLSHLEDWDCNEEQQRTALDALRDRYLVEEFVENNQCLLRQHNLIRSVSLERLSQLDNNRKISIKSNSELTLAELGIDLQQVKKIKPNWKRNYYRAVINWLTKYQLSEHASNLDKVRGYLEAFYYLCEVEDWEVASKILFTRLNTPTKEELYKQLGTWGYYQEQFDLCSTILGKFNSNLDISLLNTIGNSLSVFGDYSRAIDYLKQSLTIAREIQDRKGEEIALLNLGKAYEALADYQRAIHYHQQSLLIAQEIEDRLGEGQALTNLGLVYENLGDYAQTVNYSQRSLAIAQEIGDRKGEGQALINLGNVYINQGQYQIAIEHYQQSLAIARQIGDPFAEGRSLITLGNAYTSLGQYSKAIEYYQQSLAFSQGIQDRRGEEMALANLGFVYYYLGEYTKAIEYNQQSLTIAREIGDRHGVGSSLGNLGNAHYILENYAEAIEYHQQHLTIAQEIGDRIGEGQALGNLGIAYSSIGDYAKAIEYHQQQLTIAQAIGELHAEGNTLGNLGNVYFELGEYERAIAYQRQYLEIAQKIGDRLGYGRALCNLGHTLIQLSQYQEALEALQTSLQIFREIGSRSSEAEVLMSLAEVHQQLGNLNLAIKFCDQALAIAIELGIPLANEYQEFKNRLVNAG